MQGAERVLVLVAPCGGSHHVGVVLGSIVEIEKAGGGLACQAGLSVVELFLAYFPVAGLGNFGWRREVFFAAEGNGKKESNGEKRPRGGRSERFHKMKDCVLTVFGLALPRALVGNSFAVG